MYQEKIYLEFRSEKIFLQSFLHIKKKLKKNQHLELDFIDLEADFDDSKLRYPRIVAMHNHLVK